MTGFAEPKMSSLTLTPPTRKSEAWKYVTPSILKELAEYKPTSEGKDSPDLEGLTLNKGAFPLNFPKFGSPHSNQ